MPAGSVSCSSVATARMSASSVFRTSSTAVDLRLAEDAHRRPEEAQHEPLRLAGRCARGVLAQYLEIAFRVRICRLRALEIGGIDDHVGARELPELVQLRRRERRLSRTAPADHHDLANARSR